MVHKKPKIIVICGPTGIGKTSLAIQLATAYRGEIISADSMQIYRYLNIGTAKPTPEEQARVRHHMIDIINPEESFDAAQYLKMARKIILDLYNKGIISFIVGGTGLYIKTLMHGLFKPKSTDPNIRKHLKKEADTYGSTFLHEKLQNIDPDAAERIHPNDTYRIIRALEVNAITGKPLSSHHREHDFKDSPFHVLKIGLHIERERLYDRIDRRVDAMIEDGLVEEVKDLLQKGYTADLSSIQSIGYRHITALIKGDLSREEALRTLKRDSRRYAKRQLTWFNADSEIKWIDPENINQARQHIDDFITFK